MSFSYDKINNSELNRSQIKSKEKKIINPFINKKNSPNINTINNLNSLQNQETSSSGITNITTLKEKEKEFPYYSFPIKPLEENNIENYFMKKNKKMFESP